ncbi:MAG: protein TolR [Alphaproteobacteria bacterium]|nr:protein TolR [Alphaproteobacteria bacterium]NCQ66792.1 protein TolR [Alphaproteobacteria bacterium]NCT07360.1 protein TolR [Alphaproteobacteria bacterium]
MAVSFTPSNGTGRQSSRSKRPPMSEINITPLVDVMLVLLVIFMITAPMLTVGVPIDLPKTKASALNEKSEPVTLSLNKDGDLFLQETQITPEELIAKLNAIMDAKPGTRLFVRGDQSLPYGRVMELMGRLNAAGFNKVALLAELPKTLPSSPGASKKRSKS